MRFKKHGFVGIGLACALALTQLVAVCAGEPVPIETKRPWLPDIEVERYKLPNGLTVTLHEDHTTPRVAVSVVYNVGSKDDPPGRTGFAHLFEHLMFEGSKHHDESHSWPIFQFMTKTNGASTNKDRTVYHETVTKNALERTLWLEADRMGFLLPVVTEAKLEKVRKEVKNERWETDVEPPLGEVEEVWTSVLYPPGHPYRHSIIGSFIDMSAAGVADVAPFIHKYYSPSNAFLCLAGDFDPALARLWIEKYFGPLPAGEIAAPRHLIEPTLTKPRRITLTDRVSHARVVLIWPTVPANHPDEAPLDVLAYVLDGSARWNRLSRALIHDRQMATVVSAWHPAHRLAGTFEISLTARHGQKLDELVQLTDLEIDRVKREGPTADELRIVQAERRRLQAKQLESLASKASVLNDYASTLRDPLAYRSVLAKIFAVTPEDVRRVARTYLGAGRIEIEVHPGERTARSWEPRVDLDERDELFHPRPVRINDAFDRSVMPETGESPKFTSPAINRYRLSNGLDLWVVERHHLPAVILKLVVKSGESSSPQGKEGLATLTVDLLGDGTKSRSFMHLESDLIEIGSSLSLDGFMESSIVTLTTVTRHLEKALDLFADVVLNPALEDKEFLRMKLQRAAFLEGRADDAAKIAEDVFPRLLYHPGHPYARSRWGTLESVRLITLEDVVAFYRWAFVPNNATLVVVGDVQPGATAVALEARFARWQPGPVPASPDLRSRPTPAAAGTIYLIDKPGAGQSVLSVGRVGASIRAPSRRALVILAKEFSGRIYGNLSNEHGLTYGFSSTFDFRKGAGPYLWSGSVPTLDTTKALVEILNEMKELAGERMISEEQVTAIWEAMLPDWHDRFETNAEIAGELAYLVARNLPHSHSKTDLARFGDVTKADIDRLAQDFLRPRRMTILIVGDRSWIEEPLRTLPFVKTIRLLDREGKPLPRAVAWKPTPAETAALGTSP
jgi:zinc protease